jgi:hypothetical protein
MLKYFLPVPAFSNDNLTDMSVRSPLKPGINPTFRGIVVQVRILLLKMPFLPFSAETIPWKCHFFIFFPVPFSPFLLFMTL